MRADWRFVGRRLGGGSGFGPGQVVICASDRGHSVGGRWRPTVAASARRSGEIAPRSGRPRLAPSGWVSSFRRRDRSVAWTALQALGGWFVGHQVRNTTEMYGFLAIVGRLMSWVF
jgi:hypothetical protein